MSTPMERNTQARLLKILERRQEHGKKSQYMRAIMDALRHNYTSFSAEAYLEMIHHLIEEVESSTLNRYEHILKLLNEANYEGNIEVSSRVFGNTIILSDGEAWFAILFDEKGNKIGAGEYGIEDTDVEDTDDESDDEEDEDDE